MTDGPHNYFGENLRIRCSKYPSIAFICRETGINRQQFNKYLSGLYTPNSRTRARLCDFLGVTPEEMFQPPTPKAVAQDSISQLLNSNIAKLLQDNALSALFMKIGLSTSLGEARLSDGYYYCYFPLQGYPNFLVRSVLKIASRGGLRLFSRHTNFTSSTFPEKSISKGRHVGIVLSNGEEFSFLGVNQTRPSHLSLLSFPFAQLSGSRVLSGVGMTRGLNQPHATRVCLEYVGSALQDAKQMLTGNSVVGLRQHGIPPLVSSIMETPQSGEANQVTMAKLEVSFAAQLLKQVV